MLLQHLEAYAGRLSLPPRLYAETPIRYIIELDGEGRLRSPEPTDTADRQNKRTQRGTRRLAPSIQRAVGIKPLLLADKADYSLGFTANGGKADRVRACHAAYLAQVDRCVTATAHPAVAAVQRFLRDDPLAKLRLGPDFDPSGLITYRVDGVFPIDLPSVQNFWAAENDPVAAGAPLMQCVVCGQERPALGRLELKVKGVPGGQTSGTSIVSFNAEAFESYGLRASLNAPTCASCGERFTKALNDLLASEDSRIRMDNLVYVFWTKDPQAKVPFAALLNEARPEDVQALYESAFSGRQAATKLDDTPFYAAALSGSGGRAVVRDWIDTTVGRARRHLACWFNLQRIMAPPEAVPHLRLRQLAWATVRTGDRKNPPAANVTRSLLRTALTGAPLPWDLLYRAIRRNAAEQSVTRPRAALIKMVLLSQKELSKEDDMVQLNQESTSAAYHCGRLLAVLEQAQRAAIHGINKTVVDRYYGAASSAPRSVLPTLLRGARAHLDKLERDRRGAYIALERRLDEIVSHIDELPGTLSLIEQGRFALGYYHQRASDRQAVREAVERKKAGEAAPEAELAGLIEPEAVSNEEDQ